MHPFGLFMSSSTAHHLEQCRRLMQARRLRYLATQRCLGCGVLLPQPHPRHCLRCRVGRAAYQVVYRDRLRLAGRCQICGGERRITQYAVCLPCRVKRANAERDKTRVRMRERRKALAHAGGVA